MKGMRYLSRLLAAPGREHHVLDLVAAETGPGPRGDSDGPARPPRAALGDAGEMLDAGPRTPTAGASPRSTTTSSRRAVGDAERAAQADAERDFLVRELRRAFRPGWP